MLEFTCRDISLLGKSLDEEKLIGGDDTICFAGILLDVGCNTDK